MLVINIFFFSNFIKKKKKKNPKFSVTFILLSANAFNLDQAIILSSGKELNGIN